MESLKEKPDFDNLFLEVDPIFHPLAEKIKIQYFIPLQKELLSAREEIERLKKELKNK